MLKLCLNVYAVCARSSDNETECDAARTARAVNIYDGTLKAHPPLLNSNSIEERAPPHQRTQSGRARSFEAPRRGNLRDYPLGVPSMSSSAFSTRYSVLEEDLEIGRTWKCGGWRVEESGHGESFRIVDTCNT
ncbi:hypothetical protein OCU04_010567 [Sclerotinia nivalis]|uniref:Uncharacterized protein n=1 Tax=Sclerotinia nivalis TaxID=352851 RepID=A0A9X0ACC3_9HELO|nr:hypothetical protein OCU04_010567 [Sclerotinia nivalis]